METINDWLKTYLIGAMEKTKADDEGRGWRDRLRLLLERLVDKSGNPIYVFDPTLEEQNKVGMNPREFHRKINGWINSGHNSKVAEGSNLIWKGKTYIEKEEEQGRAKLVHIMGDIDYVENSDFIICRFEKGDSPCGTFGEALLSYKIGIPIYVLQTMNREEYPTSFVGWVFASNGDFFPSQNQLLEFLQKKYGLKVKKD